MAKGKFCEIFNSLLCAKQDHNSLCMMSDECGGITEQVKSTQQENKNIIEKNNKNVT
jgi:hypothetical protein